MIYPSHGFLVGTLIKSASAGNLMEKLCCDTVKINETTSDLTDPLET